MALVNKPYWWDEFSAQFGFDNSTSSKIDNAEVISTLNRFVAGHITDILSPAFLLLHGNVLTAAPEEIDRSNNLISLTAGGNDFVIGYGGSDFLSGRGGDDILYGGSDRDFFKPGAGRDIVIGGDNILDRGDTVSYLPAGSGIIVNGLQTPAPAIPEAPPKVYSFTWEDWTNPAIQNISGFKTGDGGDRLDISALLDHIGRSGADAIAQGYIRLRDDNGDLKIQFDQDGFGGASASSLVRLIGVTSAQFAPYNLSNVHIDPPAPPVIPPGEFSLVPKDGQGNYDVLYSIENIIGSDFADTIHGDGFDNILVGGLGDDKLFGEYGNDILIGGAGSDKLYGNIGDDILIAGGGDTVDGGQGNDIIKLDSVVTGIKVTVQGFQAGDKLDVSAVLHHAGYNGHDAVADGVIKIQQTGKDLSVSLDFEGETTTLATIKNLKASAFSVTDNLVTEAPVTLMTQLLGQSNMSGLKVLAGDSESGLTRLQSGLEEHMGGPVQTVQKDGNGDLILLAVGGTSVNADDDSHDLSEVWWYPEAGKPGDILIRAVDYLAIQLADLRAHGNVTPTIVWGQGEGDAATIGFNTTEEGRVAAAEHYMNATRSVFDYIKDRLGDDIQFYIAETGRYDGTAARLAGISQARVDATQLGLKYINAAQEKLAHDYSDVKIGVNYRDLPLLSEVSQAQDPVNYLPEWAKDTWHLHYESREVIGSRLADFIAMDQGANHVLENAGPYPRYMLDDLDLKGSSGVIASGGLQGDILVGTLGEDSLHGQAGNDVLMGGAGKDTLYGDAGSDIFYYDHSVYDDVMAAQLNPSADIADIIEGFETGAGGDALDLSALLKAAGYTGMDAIADGYVSIGQDGANTIVSFDPDGAAGATSHAVVIAQLTGIDSSTVNLADNLLLTVPQSLL